MNINEENIVTVNVSWEEIDQLLFQLINGIKTEGIPDVIVGLQRGGLIPSVILSHNLNVRELITLDVRRTLNDNIEAEKVDPIIYNEVSFNFLTAKDVLVVDDVAGSGITLRMVLQRIRNTNSPRRIRSLACYLNLDKWEKTNSSTPNSIISYIGKEVRGWLIFPWETHK